MKNEKYFKTVFKAFGAEIKAIKKATTTTEVTVHERKIMPLLTEMQLAIPRLGEDVRDVVAERRKELKNGR